MVEHNSLNGLNNPRYRRPMTDTTTDLTISGPTCYLTP
jgi:hypothetical protein